jgi:hypothetical protein
MVVRLVRRSGCLSGAGLRLAAVEAEAGPGLPDFVKDELGAFLECGILTHGFLRLRRADCAHDKLVAVFL